MRITAVLVLVLIASVPAVAQITLEGHTTIKRTSPNVIIQDTSSGSTFLIAARPTASFFGTFTNSNFGIRVGNVDLIRLTTGQRVGIGTVSPISRLHVKGDVRVQNGSFIDDGTFLNVPDYVFEDDYPLMPIDELARFVGRERHLPNVPSAEDIEANGIRLGEFSMSLLEKVEELTLYVLQQQEQYAALQAEHRGLRQEFSELRAAVASGETIPSDPRQ